MSDATKKEVEGDAPIDEAAIEYIWPYTVKLETPVVWAKKEIGELVFRKGIMGDMAGIKLQDSLPADDLMLIASRMCNQPIQVIRLLDIDDASEVTRIATDFYTRFLVKKTPTKR